MTRGSASPTFSRRALLGWFLSIGSAAGIMALISWLGFSGLFSKTGKAPLQKHDRAKAKRKARRAVSAAASVVPRFVLTEWRGPRRQLQSSLVHWIHPQFNHQPRIGHATRAIQPKEVPAKVHPRCSKNASMVRKGTTHFYPPLESITRENLALASINVLEVETNDTKNGTKNGTNANGMATALALLMPLFDDDRHRCDWRIYSLYARLYCCKEPDAKAAYNNLLATVWKRKDRRPQQLAFLASLEQFEKWHARSRSSTAVRRLQHRIETANSMIRGLSSNGQDTATAEAPRSNRARPLSPTQKETRKLKLSRRHQRRKARRGNSADQTAILWHRMLRNLELNTNRRDSNGIEATVPSAPRVFRQIRKSKRFHRECSAPRQNLPTIPSVRKVKRRGRHLPSPAVALDKRPLTSLQLALDGRKC